MKQQVYTSSKFFHEVGPCAYRNWQSETDCYLLHGYCRSFKFVFGCKHLDKQGFVVDFGGLKDFKRWIGDKFDHTVILQADDPMVSVFRKLESKGHLKLQTFPLISSEGLAEYVGEYMDQLLQKNYNGRCWVISSEHIEAEKNGAIYRPQENPDRLTFDEIDEMTKEIEASAQNVELESL